MSPKSSDRYPYKNREGTQRHRAESHVKTEAQIRAMLPEAKEQQEPQKLEETRKDSAL